MAATRAATPRNEQHHDNPLAELPANRGTFVDNSSHGRGGIKTEAKGSGALSYNRGMLVGYWATAAITVVSSYVSLGVLSGRTSVTSRGAQHHGHVRV